MPYKLFLIIDHVIGNGYNYKELVLDKKREQRRILAEADERKPLKAQEERQPGAPQSAQSGRATPRSAREMMLDSVIGDFTYKPGNEDQRKMWNNTIRIFEAFESQVEAVIDEVNDLLDTISLRDSEYYHDYRTELKRAKRWCNTGIANDYPVEKEASFVVEGAEYPGPIEGTPPRVNYCEIINVACYTAITQLVMFIPIGRGLSIARTAMQDVRGALLDLINKNWRD